MKVIENSNFEFIYAFIFWEVVPAIPEKPHVSFFMCFMPCEPDRESESGFVDEVGIEDERA